MHRAPAIGDYLRSAIKGRSLRASPRPRRAARNTRSAARRSRCWHTDIEGYSRTRTPFGTIGFIAPEQARGRWELVGRRTDLWSLGATMFMLLSGRMVHEEVTTNEQLLAAMTERADASGALGTPLRIRPSRSSIPSSTGTAPEHGRERP